MSRRAKVVLLCVYAVLGGMLCTVVCYGQGVDADDLANYDDAAWITAEIPPDEKDKWFISVLASRT